MENAKAKETFFPVIKEMEKFLSQLIRGLCGWFRERNNTAF